jgi:tetratricopeptide (TPR) repeat protein
MSRWPSLRIALAALVLAGCATPPPAPAPAQALPVRTGAPPPAAGIEQAYRQRAAALTAERRLADAVVQWELLTVLRPDSREYRGELEAARRRAAEAADALLRAADQARQRGNAEQAATLYLRALSADPANAQAASALKAIEVERTRRTWLTRAPRVPYAPPGQTPPYDPSTDNTGPAR